ncbi:MAG: Xaa-Pro peptidase family protein [Thaumarchaeota archaeon]|nr:Xaa-Pro peptidase family protein [Nitrososphaerota archaeon]
MRTRDPEWVDFDEPEYSRRISRAREAMKAHDLDALFLTQYKNVYYFSGYLNAVPAIASDQVCAAIIKRDGTTRLLDMEWTRNIAEETSWIRSHTFFSGIQAKKQNVLEVLSRTFSEMGLKGARIGAEFGEKQSVRLPTEILLDLLKSGPDLVDGAPALWDCRMVKSELEVDRVRQAARIASRALDRAFAEARVGMTEVEFSRRLGQLIMEEGADVPTWMIVSSGRRLGPKIAGAYPVERKLRRGDYLQVDLGATFHRYTSDVCRMAYVGGAPPRADSDLWDVYAEADRKGTRAVRPGVRASSVYQAITDVFEEAGYRFTFDTGGHGLGLDGHEPPNLGPGDETVIRPGMVFSIEPDGVANKDGVAFTCEDNIVCTEGGSERLSTLGWDLVQI